MDKRTSALSCGLCMGLMSDWVFDFVKCDEFDVDSA